MSRVYDQWLDSRKHESDEFDHEFEMRTERHLQTDWNPTNYETFTQAIFDADFEPWRTELTDAVASEDSAQIGWAMWQIAQGYCKDKAKQLAKQEMGQS